MNFNDFLNQAWADHANGAQAVADRMGNGMELLNDPKQIPQLAQLITHVLGEHLGQWDKGIALLKALEQFPQLGNQSEMDSSVQRSIVSLQIAKGLETNVGELSPSDQIRALAVSAAALCGQGEANRAKILFQQALMRATELGLAKEDPANRSLAITGNNLACALSEKSSLSSEDLELMLLAAKTGRKYWEIAGGWMEVERAEYRLSLSYLKAGQTDLGLLHAQQCIEIAQKNQAPALEMFFGYEALAIAEKARGNSEGFEGALAKVKNYFEQLSAEDKKWCESSLAKL